MVCAERIHRCTISTPVRDGSWQRANKFIDELKHGTVSLSDEEFAMTERLVERRGRDAAQVTVTPVGTVQYCFPRSPTPNISSDVRVYIEENKEGMVDPERDELEPQSAGTGLETPGQQCPPNGETGRTIVDGLPINPLTMAKIITTVSGSMCRITLGIGSIVHPA